MLKITPISVKSLLLQWQDMEGDSFTIYKSTSPNDGYDVIETHHATPFYVDNDVNLHDVGLRYYYKIEGYEGGVVVSTLTGESMRYNNRDNVANKIMHEFSVILRVMNNPPVKVLLKRRTGKRCPNCWNPITNKVRFSNCEVCNGTGVISGYHKPIETRISRDFSQLVDYTSMLDGEKVNKTSVNAWISNFPLVSPGDVIVDTMNQRFLIERVAQRTKSQFIIRQVLDLVPLEVGHPSYLVQVDWGDEF